MRGLKALRTGKQIGAPRAWISLFLGLALPACAFWELSDWDAKEGTPSDPGLDSGIPLVDGEVPDAGPAPTHVEFQNGVSPTSTYMGTVDTVIRENDPNLTGGTTDPLQVDHDSPIGKRVVALMRFDVSDLKGRKVVSAQLRLNITDPTSGPSPFSMFALMRPWSEANATWLLADPGNWTFPGAQQDAGGSPDRGISFLGQLGPKDAGLSDIDFTAAGITLVQTWIDEPAKNFGFLFDTRDNGDGLFFSSATAPAATDRPRLAITLQAP